MPTNGHHFADWAAIEHRVAKYERGKARAAATLEAAATARREADRERRELEREQRANARFFVAETRREAAQKRADAAAQLNGLRMDPAYDLWQRWGNRVDSGTVYDATHWRKSGRLVPVTSRTKYADGGTTRREIVDWVDVLDREAQERGIEANDLPRHFDRLRRGRELALRTAREADELRRDADSQARQAGIKRERAA